MSLPCDGEAPCGEGVNCETIRGVAHCRCPDGSYAMHDYDDDSARCISDSSNGTDMDRATTAALAVEVCSLDPCSGRAKCIIYDSTFRCSCPNGMGYIGVGRQCPTLDGVGSIKNWVETESFVNVSSSLDLCKPNPCGDHIKCIPFGEPHCRCATTGVYLPVGQPCPEKKQKQYETYQLSAKETYQAGSGPSSTYILGGPQNHGMTAASNDDAVSLLKSFHYVAIAVVGILVMLALVSLKTSRSLTSRRPDGKEEISLASSSESWESDDWLADDSVQTGDADTLKGGGSQSNIDDCGPAKMSYWKHFINISKISGYIICSEVFQNTLPLIDVAFVAHLSAEDLGAAALATVWFMFWHTLIIGSMTALDTFLAQSFGAKDKLTFRVWAGTGFVIVQVFTLVMSGIIALCGPAMKLFGQDPKLADMAGAFCYRLIPGLFPLYGLRVFMKYLQTQNILNPGAAIGSIACALNVLLNWLLIFELDMGIDGAPWATTLTRFVEFFMILGYMLWKKNTLFQSTWPIVSVTRLAALANLGAFLDLATSGALGFAACTAFDITAIFAGWLGTVELDAHIITLTLESFIFASFSLAGGLAAAIRVGQLIGEGNVADARRAAMVSSYFNVATHAILTSVILPLSEWLSQKLSSDEEVTALAASLIPIFCVFLMVDAVQETIVGVLTGLGHQRTVLALRVLGLWVVGLPVCWCLAFPIGWGVSGLWWGLVIGIYVTCLLGIMFFKVRIDWNLEKRRAEERLSSRPDAQESRLWCCTRSSLCCSSFLLSKD